MNARPRALRDPDLHLPLGDTLDVRVAGEFQVGHFASAISCPLDRLARSLHVLPPRDRAFWVFGENGETAAALALLHERGYTAAAAHPATAPGAAPSAPVSSAWVGGDARVRLWQATPFLTEVLREIEMPGRALDVACGSGRDACALALAGFDTTGVDALPDALERAAGLAAETSLALRARGSEASWRPPRFLRADLERGWPWRPGSFDLVLCARFLWRPLWRDLALSLRPGGSLVHETFLRGQAAHGKPSRPEHLLDPFELSSAFEALGLTVVGYRESAPDRPPVLASLWAKRPLPAGEGLLDTVRAEPEAG